MTKYKPNTRSQSNKIRNVIIIVAIAAIASGIIAAANAGMIQPPKAPTTGGDDNKPMVMHIHPKLSFILDGKPTPVPANIGIDSSLYNNHTLDAYGMKMPEMKDMPVMYPTHTHETSGVIHVESNEKRDYTLGDFLSVWGMDFSGKTVKITVDGKSSSDDYRSHIFRDGEQISLDVR